MAEVSMEEEPQPIAALPKYGSYHRQFVLGCFFAEQISLSGWARGFPNEIPDLEFHFGVARGRGFFLSENR